VTAGRELHLPDLAIEGFRGIDELAIPRLGRVNLITGPNAVGKTTVLDAVRIYASRSDDRVLSDLLTVREELSAGTDEEGVPWREPDWSALFHGRQISAGTPITVRSGGDQLIVQEHYANREEASHISQLYFEFGVSDHIRVLTVTFRGQQWTLPCLIEPDVDFAGRRDWRRRRRFGSDDSLPSKLTCESLGPGALTNTQLARFWDEVALTDHEDRATRALSLVLGDTVDRVTMVGDNGPNRRGGGRRVVVKLRGFRGRVPLKSLGDGALRMFGVALALSNSRNGLLLVDEAENGIHHSVQPDYWHMVFRTAFENNVQVLATTHSWDCVTGFAKAAAANEDVEGVLVRLDKVGESIQVVHYPEEEVRVAAEQGIEVR